MSRLSLRARWAVPAGAVALTGIAIAATTVASADVSPSLPARSAAQLLASAEQASAKPLGPLTATVQETASLGFPQLPSDLTGGQAGGGPAASGPSAASLISGTQSVSYWYLDPQHVRVAVPTQGGESDARLSGRALWLWSSNNQTATHVALPSHFTTNVGDKPGSPRRRIVPSGRAPDFLPANPLAAANQVLKEIGPSTAVSVQRTLYVAGRPAYQLSLEPRSSQSLVGRVLLAIDASRHIPLRVQVYARASDSLAYSIGFTALTFGKPAASNFSFTPPAGATVRTESVPSNLPATLRSLGLGGWTATTPLSPPASPFGTAGQPTAMGKDWLQVLATPPSPEVAAAVQSLLANRHPATTFNPGGPTKQATAPASASGPADSSETIVNSSTLPVNAPVGPDLAILQALLKATVQAHGAWGSGRLLTTKLLSVLITSDGRILAGAVTPAVLYADAAIPAK
ncbi:MAG TPA: hypothetical protein VGI58_06020 [Streptosporangiaceae bacterium]